MDRIRKIFAEQRQEPQEYAPLTPASRDDESESLLEGEADGEGKEEVPFSWVEYFIFVLIGVAMLWAWNMFLAAAPYFQKRFQSDEWISQRFQSAIITVFTLTSLPSMLILAKRQSSASYPFRINAALVFNTIVFALLALSTVWFVNVSTGGYLAFLLLMSACSSFATGLLQNGALAFAASFGRPEYTQAIMSGQGIAGVLPPIAQIVSVLAVPPSAPSESTLDDVPPPPPPQEAGKAAFVYFLTAVVVCVATFLAFIPLVRRHNRLVELRLEETMAQSMASVEEAERAARKVVGLGTLARKLRWVGGSAFMCFAVAMFFPVFTAKIVSVRPPEDQGRLFQPGAFIPLGFFFWNLGDLAGRVATLLPFSLRRRPRFLFAFAVARLVFLPMYALCNVGGRGAAVGGDAFYLLGVQLPFGLTNGWLGSSAMMAAGEWVEEGEREAAGGFMGLCLVAALAAGSLLSFSVAGI